MGVWDTVMGLVKTGEIVAHEAAALVNASIAAYHDVKSGEAKTPLEAILKQGETLKPILETVMNFLVPGSGTGVEFGLEAVAFILSHSHKMTPEEEQAWFDRASQVSSGGM